MVLVKPSIHEMYAQGGALNSILLGDDMYTSELSFDCPVAKHIETVQSEIVFPRCECPPVENFKDCDGLATCGDKTSYAAGSASFNWNLCPLHQS